MAKEPTPVEVNGSPLRCVVCQHDAFHTRTAQLHTAAATFFGLDWANRSAVCHVCAQCGYIHWFLPDFGWP